MIDINSELLRMSQEFEIPEKEVATNFRQAVRSMWSDSVFKRDFLKRFEQKVVNTNPRSMKRFPVVTRYPCALCGELFGSNDIEIDHIHGEQPMTKLDHAEDFLKFIFFTSPNELRLLCKDKKSKVKGKPVVTRFGCHGVDTYSQRYDVSFEYARKYKEYLNICKDVEVLSTEIENRGYAVPVTKVGKERLLKSLMELD